MVTRTAGARPKDYVTQSVTRIGLRSKYSPLFMLAKLSVVI